MNRQSFAQRCTVPISTIFALSLALVVEVLAAEPFKPSCEDVQRRVHGHGPATLRKVWQELGITPEVYVLAEWQNPTNEFAEKVVLQVHRESGAFSGKRSRYVLLVISSAPYGPHQYLFFVQTGATCRYIGHVDAWDKYKQPQYRFMSRGYGGTFFVLELYAGSGTGFYRELEWWYAVDEKDVRFVLGYPFKGHEQPAGNAPTIFEFSTSSEYKSSSDTERIDLVVRAEYQGMLRSLDGAYFDLFSTRREAVFAWNAIEQRFVLSQPAEISIGYLDWMSREWTDQGFLEYHAVELTEIAKDGTAEQKSWLQKLLDSTVGPQAETLKAMLSAEK